MLSPAMVVMVPGATFTCARLNTGVNKNTVAARRTTLRPIAGPNPIARPNMDKFTKRDSLRFDMTDELPATPVTLSSNSHLRQHPRVFERLVVQPVVPARRAAVSGWVHLDLQQ